MSNLKISETFESVRAFSFEEKKTASTDEETVNSFLDSILEFKNIVSIKTDKINSLIEDIESITWLNDLDDTSMILINDIISAIRSLFSSLNRQYVSYNIFRSKGIAKQEIKSFKNAIEELNESANDLESAFFNLPTIEGFKETTRQLSLV